MPQRRDDNTTLLVVDAATQGCQYNAAHCVLALNATTLGCWDACKRGVMTRARMLFRVPGRLALEGHVEGDGRCDELVRHWRT